MMVSGHKPAKMSDIIILYFQFTVFYMSFDLMQAAREGKLANWWGW